MNDSPKCHMCIYETCPAECKEENCPTLESGLIEVDHDNKEIKKKTFKEVMELMNRRSGDGL